MKWKDFKCRTTDQRLLINAIEEPFHYHMQRHRRQKHSQLFVESQNRAIFSISDAYVSSNRQRRLALIVENPQKNDTSGYW